MRITKTLAVAVLSFTMVATTSVTAFAYSGFMGNEEALEERVSDGTITQEQADSIQEMWDEREQAIADGEWSFGGMGCGMMGGYMMDDEALAERVADGTITQEQADSIQEMWDEREQAIADGTWTRGEPFIDEDGDGVCDYIGSDIGGLGCGGMGRGRGMGRGW